MSVVYAESVNAFDNNIDIWVQINNSMILTISAKAAPLN